MNTATAYPDFSVLMIDDEPSFLRSLSLLLERKAGINNILRCDDSRLAMEMVKSNPVGLILLDLTMPHVSGKELLTQFNEQCPDIPVIIISGLNQVESAVDCLQSGAFDYFVKTTEESRLVEGVKRAIRMQQIQRENQALGSRILTNSLEQPEVFDPIISRSQAMRSIFQYLESIANSHQPLLIQGESGTGKELLAQAAHKLSKCSGPLVTVNVAGLDDNVFADTLFGHQRGAFTGAQQARAGLIEQANQGTLFLDEIGDLSTSSQVKLLRLLQEGEYYPLGSDKPKKSSARIIVATHQDLAKRQEDGLFRTDLYYRLCTHQVNIPALRNRKEDIAPLLDFFLQQASDELDKAIPGYPNELIALLNTYHFPGNVRELRALVFDSVSRHKSHMLSMQSFKQHIGYSDNQPLPETADTVTFNPDKPLPTLAEIDQLLMNEALQRANNNQSLAARLLGISQPALSKRLKKQAESK